MCATVVSTLAVLGPVSSSGPDDRPCPATMRLPCAAPANSPGTSANHTRNASTTRPERPGPGSRARHGSVGDMTPDLDGVRALVTGGTSGLGFAMSQALADAGARVVLTGRTEQRVQDAATRIAPGTGLVMDVRDEQSVSAGVDRALAILGGIDVLVNNAGIGIRTVNPDFMTEPAGFWQVSPDGFRDLFATNVLGYFLVARAVAGSSPAGSSSA